MKKVGLLTLGLFLLFAACKKSKETPDEPVVPSETEAAQPEIPDSTLWGHLGEDTGMSTLQFITDAGDTLEVYRTSQYTGKDGCLIGEVRNYTDRFAVTLTEGNETLVTAINMTQLIQQWYAKNGSMTIKGDGTITSDDMPYNGWKLWNGHFLLSSEQRQEYGMVSRIDTMDIIWLDNDSLIIRDHINQIQAFSTK